MIKHLKDENFQEEIKSGLVLVDFYADWCGPCRMVGPIVEEISNEVENLKVIKINVDEREDIAKMYGIMSIPTLILFKEGEINKKQIGFVPKEVLMQWFE